MKTGEKFERAVAEVHALLNPTFTVEHDVRIVDRLGHRRQFDVVMRGTIGGQPVLCVIECKDLRRKVSVKDVDAFANTATNVRASIPVIVSRTGFTKRALESARFHGIATYSLLTTPNGEVRGVELDPWYALLYSWRAYKFGIHFDPATPPPEQWDYESVSVRGQLLSAWIERELFTTYGYLEADGQCVVELAFHEMEPASVGGRDISVAGFRIEADRLLEKRIRRGVVRGRAYYDWSAERILIPGGEPLVLDRLNPELTDWDPFVGPVPAPKKTGFNVRLLRFALTDALPDLVLDLSSLGEKKLVLPDGSILEPNPTA